jgi:TonB family protein
VIEVTIGADGKLLGSVVRRSSGHAEIDEAAMRILMLASPYDPFPSELASRHDEIRIAYEWQFLDGSAQGSSVYYADPDKPAEAAPAGAQGSGAQPPGAPSPPAQAPGTR